MAYIKPETRKRFSLRINDTERRQLETIMQREGIPDIAKTIRYCIEQETQRLEPEPMQPEGGE